MSTSAEARAIPAARLQGFGLLALTACSWGFNWPVAKYLLGELPPFSMRAVCCAAGAAFAFLLAAARREALRPPAGHWRRLVLFALLNYGVFVVFTTLSLLWLTASEAVIVAYTLPIWAVVLAWPMLGERLTPRRGLALVLGLAGVALLVGVGGVHAEAGKLPGVACGLVAAVLFGLATVIAKRQPLGMPPVAGVAWQVLLGGTPVFLLAVFEHPDWGRVTALGWAGLVYAAIMPMTLAYLAWFRALQLLPASTAAIGVLLSPVVGVFSSALLLGDPLGARQVLALAMTLGGIALAARG